MSRAVLVLALVACGGPHRQPRSDVSPTEQQTAQEPEAEVFEIPFEMRGGSIVVAARCSG